ncbi:MAG: hypothetical protein V3U87_01035 [Methylococcaceae bacterium]
MKKIFLLIFTFLFSSSVSAEEIIKSIRSIYNEQGNMYISAGRDNNHSDNAHKLQSLWLSINDIEFRDSYKQDWKAIRSDEISFNKGSEATNFIVIHKQAISPIAVKGASIFKWECDYSIVPTLNLGRWPFHDKPSEWDGMAIEIEAEYGAPIITPANMDFISYLSDNEKKQLLITDYFPAIELRWAKLKNLRVILTKYKFGYENYGEELIIINKTTKQVKVLQQKSPFDGSC